MGELSLTVRTQVEALSSVPTQSCCHVACAVTEVTAARRTSPAFILQQLVELRVGVLRNYLTDCPDQSTAHRYLAEIVMVKTWAPMLLKASFSRIKLIPLEGACLETGTLTAVPWRAESEA